MLRLASLISDPHWTWQLPSDYTARFPALPLLVLMYRFDCDQDYG